MTKKQEQTQTYVVYKHTNKVNGKIYIGITGRKSEQRWLNGRGYSQQPYFSQAIRKYGWDNFEHKILIHGLTLEQAERLEVKLIAYYKSDSGDYGYNCSKGGKYRNHSEKGKEKIRQAHLGRKNFNAKEVYSIVDGRIFGSAAEAARFYQIKDSHTVCEECRGERKIQRFIYMSDYMKLSDKDKKELKISLEKFLKSGKSFHSLQKEVISLIDGKIFHNTKQCCLYYNLGKSTVMLHCNGSTKLRRFMYVEDYNNLTQKEKQNAFEVAKRSLEFKERTFQSFKKFSRNSIMNQPIICLVDGKIFNDARECVNFYGLHSVDNVSKHCRNKCVTQKFMFLKEFEQLSQEKQKELRKRAISGVKSVISEDNAVEISFKYIDGKKVANEVDPYRMFKKPVIRLHDRKIYNSIRECSDDNNLPEHTISRHCQGYQLVQEYMLLEDYLKYNRI